MVWLTVSFEIAATAAALVFCHELTPTVPPPGIRALLVHAKDDPASHWYLHWEFKPSPSDPFHLFLLMKDIKAMVGKA